MKKGKGGARRGRISTKEEIKIEKGQKYIYSNCRLKPKQVFASSVQN